MHGAGSIQNLEAYVWPTTADIGCSQTITDSHRNMNSTAASKQHCMAVDFGAQLDINSRVDCPPFAELATSPTSLPKLGTTTLLKMH